MCEFAVSARRLGTTGPETLRVPERRRRQRTTEAGVGIEGSEIGPGKVAFEEQSKTMEN